MTNPEIDVQAWLDRAADEHMGTKQGARLADCLATPLPPGVRQSNVTVTITGEDSGALVVFTAVSRDGTEYSARRYA